MGPRYDQVKTGEDWKEFFSRVASGEDKHSFYLCKYISECNPSDKVGWAFFDLYFQSVKWGKIALQLRLECFATEFCSAELKNDGATVRLGVNRDNIEKGFKKKFDEYVKFICGAYEDIYSEEIKTRLKNEVAELKEEVKADKNSIKKEDSKDLGKGEN